MSAQHTPGPWGHDDRPEAWYGGALESVRVTVEFERYVSSPVAFCTTTRVGEREALANARLMSAAPELLAALEEAVRIERARLILADGLDDNGHPFTEAQKLDAKAFLSKRRANWIHEAVAATAKASGSEA